MGDSIALVTGASRGLGRAIALRLAREGAAVGVNFARRAADAEATVAEIRANGGTAIPLQADIADRDQVVGMVDALSRTLGPPQILVNNAAILRLGELDDWDVREMDVMRRTNVDGVVHTIQAVLPGMKAQQFGRIINISSIAAHGTALARNTFYAATKGAVNVLTRRFAMELGPHGITVNTIAPGFIATDMASQDQTDQQAADLRASAASRAMVRRVGAPEDIAHAVAFLASPRSGFITAQILTVDGGRTDYITHS